MRDMSMSYSRHCVVVPCTEITMQLSAFQEILDGFTIHSPTELCARLDISIAFGRIMASYIVSLTERTPLVHLPRKKYLERDLNGRMDLHLIEVLDLDL